MTTPRRPPDPGHAQKHHQLRAAALGGALAATAAAGFAPPGVQPLLLVSTAILLTALLHDALGRPAGCGGCADLRRRLDALGLPLALAPHHGLYAQYRAVADAFAALAERADPALHEFALMKLGPLTEQVQALSLGRVVFPGTEGWRTAYERLLTRPDVKRYHSAAWVRSADYWQDSPGRQSMRLNFAAAGRGVWIERVLILPTRLWPPAAPLPAPEVRSWLHEQHDHGLRLSLVREDELAADPDLLCDFGIYGGRAVGTHELDEHARTVRFTLDFDPHAVAAAARRWERLLLYATPYAALLDQTPPPGYEH